MRKVGQQDLAERGSWLDEMVAARVEALGGSAGPLGKPADWSDALRTTMTLTLQAGFPMFVIWGPQRVLIYNDAYVTILGERHPGAFGRPFFEVWPELLPSSGPIIEAGFGGRPSFFVDREVAIRRNGRSEPAWFTFSYNPVRDAQGAVAGLLCICTETTEVVLARKTAEDARLRQHQMFEQAPGLICILEGPDHVFSFTNAAHRRLFGRNTVGLPIRAAYPELEGQGFFEILDRVRAEGERHTGRAAPLLIEAGPGRPAERRHFDFVCEPMRDDAGLVTGIFCEGFDVTASVHERLDRERSEARLRLAIDTAGLALWSIDAQGRVEVTPELNRLVGLPADAQPTMEDLLASYYPGEVERVRGLTTAALERGERQIQFEYRHLLPGGEIRWLMVRAELLGAPGGELLGSLGVAMDITDRKRAEIALAELNQRLETEVAERTAERDRMWRLSNELMLVADFEARIVAVNPAWRSLGYSVAELEGGSFLDLVHPDDLASTLAEVGRLSEGATTFAFENRYRHKDGGWRTLAWTAVPDAEFIHAVARDVTRERDAAEALRRTEEALRQSQKMEAVGQLTGGIAHDFNNMLAIVIGSLDLAKRRLERGDAATVQLDAAREGAVRAASLTQRLLAFSRQQPLSPRVVHLNRLIEEMSEILRRTLGERISLETRLGEDLWAVHADPHQLENALLNLAVNARDAMPTGGRLTIESRNIDLEAGPAAEEIGLAAGRYVEVAVRDQGCGMTSETLARVFEPFFTTKPVGKGTGLGLSMVYGFVRQSRGAVILRSEVGVGTTAVIYLPRHSGPAGEREVEAAAHGPISGAGELVLVVEDEERVREMSVSALRDLGYQVFAASGGAEALDVIEALPRLDLLFTDLVMAGMTGRELAQAVRARDPDVRVLFTTGYTSDEAVRSGALEAGVEVMPKPFGITELASRVRALLDRPR